MSLKVKIDLFKKKKNHFRHFVIKYGQIIGLIQKVFNKMKSDFKVIYYLINKKLHLIFNDSQMQMLCI